MNQQQEYLSNSILLLNLNYLVLLRLHIRQVSSFQNLLAKLFLERAIVRASGILLAEAVTREAVANSDGGPVVILEKFCPWQGVVIKEAPNALFIVFPAITGDWRIQCIPPSLGSRDKRKPLPAAWGGLAGEALQSESGVDDAVFCHVGLFIGGASTREGALALAELAVQA